MANNVPDMDDLMTPGALLPLERWWRDRQPFLQSKGYILRPRLRPDWTPSWIEGKTHRLFCEDAILSPSRPSLMDARRISDNAMVYIKRMKTDCNEVKIATFLTSGAISQDPRNHCVPILDVFQDSDDSTLTYVVMPFLRGMDSPPFSLVVEVMDFIDQILEGLVFLHEVGVAHRDCSRKNILMDGNAMFPSGFHPVRDMALPDYSDRAPYYLRSEVPVKYYYVDFGISVFIPPDHHPKLALGADGRDREVPELSLEVPYDPFKVDIFIIGNVFRRELQDKYSNLGFLSPLIDNMTQNNPDERPDAQEALVQWRRIRPTIHLLRRRWQLRSREHSWLEQTVFDAVSLVNIVAYIGRSIGKWGADTQG